MNRAAASSSSIPFRPPRRRPGVVVFQRQHWQQTLPEAVAAVEPPSAVATSVAPTEAKPVLRSSSNISSSVTTTAGGGGWEGPGSLSIDAVADLLVKVREATDGMSTSDVVDVVLHPRRQGANARLRALSTYTRKTPVGPVPEELVEAWVQRRHDCSVAKIPSADDLVYEQFRAPAADHEAFTEAQLDAVARVLDASAQGSPTSSLTTTATPAPTAAASRRPRSNELTEKERTFLAAFSDVARALRQTGIPFFVTCGTALGVVRDGGRFIPHDTDIDLGVFFRDLATQEEEGMPAVPSSGPVGRPAEKQEDASAAQASLERAQSRLIDLLSVVGTSSACVAIDVLGTLDAGFQLRLQHRPTGVLIDLNAYYDAVDPADGTTFVWSATHYGESSKRTTGMYRYRNSAPLRLERRRLYHEDIWCPTEAYLEEYFGPTWRTPKVFGYEEGLAGEYKNIIPE